MAGHFSSAAKAALAAFGVAAVIRLALIAAFPVLPLGDSYARLDGLDRWVVGLWLPGYQALLWAVGLFFSDVWVLRAVTALADAGAVGVLTGIVTRWQGPRVGLALAWLLATAPTWVFPSLALRQEPLFWLLSAGGLAAVLSGRTAAAALFLGASATVRYEAWLLAPCIVAVGLLEGRLRRRQALWVMGAVGLAVLSWLVTVGGISPMGTRSLDVSWSSQRWLDQLRMLRQQVPYWMGAPVLLGLAGLVWLPRRPSVVLLAVCVLGHSAAVAVLHPYAPMDTPRQLALLTGFLALAGAMTLRGRWPAVAGALVLLAGLQPLVRVSGDARGWFGTGSAATAVAVAQQLPEDAGVLVLAQGWPQWPEAESRECVAVRALRRAGPTWCDASVTGEAEAWVEAHGITWVVQVGALEPWRPVHHWALEQTAIRDGVGDRRWTWPARLPPRAR